MLILKPYFDPEAGANPQGGATGGQGGTPPASDNKPDEKETTELQGLVSKENLTDQEKARLTELQGKYDLVPKDENGKPLSPEQIAAAKEVEKKFNAILAKPEDQRTQEEKDFLVANSEEAPKKSLYEEVDELTGEKYDIDYGDVKPDSPQGVVLREEAIKKNAILNFEKSLKEKYHRAYQFMYHLSQGGKEEDFFKPENQDFKTLTVKKDDPANNERVIRTALAAKGNSPAVINAVVAAVKDGEMYEMAKTELEALQNAQTQREQRREQLAEQRRVKEEADANALGDQIDNALEKGFDGIVIPVAERSKFGQFLYDRLEYDNGEFLMVKKLNTKELNKELKVAWFEFKGGDLKGLVERSAKSQAALKFKGAIKYDIVPKGAAPKPNRVPMGQV